MTTYLVGVIRQYRPAVVLTHDAQGEYGHGAHIVASSCTVQAVRYTDEATRYPQSAELYGAWQVLRLFSHQYGDAPVVIDRTRPLERFDGLNALALDRQGYAYYPETYPIEISDGPGYTSAQYGLAFAADESAFDPTSGDLFDGLDAALLGPTASPTPMVSPTPEPVKTPTPAPEEPSADGLPYAEAGIAREEASPRPTTAAVLGVLAVAALAAAILLWRRALLRRAAIAACALCLAAALVLTARGRLDGAAEGVESPAPALTPGPTATPTATASAEPTPTPDPWDAYFRSGDDPQEVVVNDPENEHWAYRSDTLSILIDRIHLTRASGEPITCCVAQIRMRGEDAFFAGVRNDNPLAQPGLEHAWRMARRYRAVLGITGDNLIQAEVDQKGILMRNGKVYSRNQAEDIMAFDPDELTIRIYKPGTISAEELLAQGVLNTFSFGPTLLNDGVRGKSTSRSNLERANPRSGLGMVEPGYFIAITVDGRQKDHSVGMTLQEFTQLFYLYGCRVAYNLDGGASTAMIFMGESLSQHSGIGSDVQRPWTDGLFWGTSDLVPGVDDPVYNDGSKPWVTPPGA